MPNDANWLRCSPPLKKINESLIWQIVIVDVDGKLLKCTRHEWIAIVWEISLIFYAIICFLIKRQAMISSHFWNSNFCGNYWIPFRFFFFTKNYSISLEFFSQHIFITQLNLNWMLMLTSTYCITKIFLHIFLWTRSQFANDLKTSRTDLECGVNV